MSGLKIFQNFAAVIGRCVIEENHFKVFVSLIVNRVEALGQEGRVIEIWNDDTHARRKIFAEGNFPLACNPRRFFPARHGKFQQRGLGGGFGRQKNFSVSGRQVERKKIFGAANKISDRRSRQRAVNFHLQAQNFSPHAKG